MTYKLKDYEHLQTEVEQLTKENESLREELKSAKKDVVTLMETVALLTAKNKELVKELAVKTFEAWLTDDENAITE